MDKNITPLPWAAIGSAGRKQIESDCFLIAEVRAWHPDNVVVQDANAAFIVKAVNAHESLVYALQMARGHITAPALSTPDLLRIVNAALAAAEGK